MTMPSNFDAVLIVDDDSSYREMVRMICEIHGLTAFEAGDCSEALKVLQVERDRIRLVLLDYVMPGMKPVQCASAITAAVNPRTRVVLVTAADNASQRAQELQLAYFLSKPFAIELLEIHLDACPEDEAA
ncbi:MAG TPA: response regulator [Terriglobia bacterium]|nr:response regulator [Terriglobia bacterium]